MSEEKWAFWNDGVWSCVQNWLFSYIAAINNQPLLIMVWTYKGNSDIDTEELHHKQDFYNMVDGFKKLPYVYGLHYTVTTRVWFLVIKICTHMVFSLKKTYAYGLCSRMGFQIRYPFLYYTLTIPVWGSTFNNTCTVSEKIAIKVWGPIPVWWCPYAYGDFMCMVTKIYIDE